MDRGEPGEGDEHHEDDEAHGVDVIGELLAGDDPPPTGEPAVVRPLPTGAWFRGCVRR